VADEVSDLEMLVVTREVLELDDCFELARLARLEGLDTWGAPAAPERHVSGYLEGAPVELIWWPRDHAQERIDALLSGEQGSAADALVHGIAVRTHGLLAAWQERLSAYPPELAAARIETAALRWGGFTPAGVLTLIRPGDRLSLDEWLVDAAIRVLTIVYALNRSWQPTTKRLSTRVASLATKPDRLAQRIEEALTELDARSALRIMTELQLETVLLAPSGPNVDRARGWLAEALELLR
jgi:hypothetical protein